MHLPPMIVRMREACPGQSTSVNCRLSYCLSPQDSLRCSGKGTVNALKPRSSVMPRSLDWGFLSKAAVDAVLLSARARDVFPLSTWPRTPTLKFSVLGRLESAITGIVGLQTQCADFELLTAALLVQPNQLNIKLSVNQMYLIWWNLIIFTN